MLDNNSKNVTRKKIFFTSVYVRFTSFLRPFCRPYYFYFLFFLNSLETFDISVRFHHYNKNRLFVSKKIVLKNPKDVIQPQRNMIESINRCSRDRRTVNDLWFINHRFHYETRNSHQTDMSVLLSLSYSFVLSLLFLSIAQYADMFRN